MNETWQKVGSEGDTHRLRVEGGWLYRYFRHQGVAMCFVPDVPYSPAIPYKNGAPTYVHH